MRAQTAVAGPSGAQNPVKTVQLVAILGSGNAGVSSAQFTLVVNTADNAALLVEGRDYLVTVNPT